MKIQDFVKSRDEANFINLRDGQLINKAQLQGEVKMGVLCMLATGEDERAMRSKVQHVLSNYEPHTQELEVKAGKFIEDMGKPTKEELEEKAHEEEIKKMEAEKLAEAKLKKIEKEKADAQKKAEEQAKKDAKESKKEDTEKTENENLDSTLETNRTPEPNP